MSFHIVPSFLVLSGLLVLSGCQSVPTAQVSGDPTVDVSRFETFHLSPIPKDSPMLDEAMKQLLTDIDGYIVTGLTRKGYVQASEEEADFIIAPRGKVAATTSVAGAQFGNYGAGTWLSGTPWGTSSVNEQSATIMVFCYAREMEKLVWLGWENSGAKQNKPDELFEGVVTALYDILSQFPARK